MRLIIMLLLLSGLSVEALIAQSSTELFRFDAKKVPVDKVFLYKKSNLDGSRSSNISVFVSSVDHLESYKWFEEYPGGSLVKATMDWTRFSVQKFESYSVSADGTTDLKGSLELPAGTTAAVIELTGMFKDTISIQHYPWQSYDFDFAGLSMIMPFVRNPQQPLEIMISDFIRTENGPTFGEKGLVKLVWQKNEEKAGRLCRRYTIDGPGLENRGGHIWFDKEQGYLVGFEIDLPDEPGYESGKLMLVEVKDMTLEQWKAFLKK